MTAFGGPAAQSVGIAGGIDAAGIGPDQNKRRDRSDQRVGKWCQAGFKPARSDLGVVVQQLDKLPACGVQPIVGGGAEPPVS